jgi:hypothetical protein
LNLKKNTATNQNWFKLTGFGSVLLFRTKISSNRFGLVFPVWLGFSGLTRFFSGFFGLGSVQFGFFGFRLIKPKSNQTSRFF